MSTNNERKSVVNTFGEQYYGKDSNENKALATRFFGDKMVLGIHRLLPESKQTQSSKYDYKNGTEVFLRPKAAKTLARLLSTAEKCRVSGEEIKVKGLPSGPNVIEVGPGKRYGCNDGTVCIAVYKDIDPETKKTDIVDVFEFKDDVLISNYNNEIGTYDEERINVDIDYLIDQLKDFAKGMSNGSIHASRTANKFDMDRMMSRQLQMMEALGIKNDTATTRTNWNGNWKSGSNNTSSTYSQTSSELLSEIEAM